MFRTFNWGSRRKVKGFIKSWRFCPTYSFFRNLVCAFDHQKMVAGFYGSRRSAIELPAASTTVPAMKKSIILVSALSVVVMALVSCASNSYEDPFRASTEPTTPEYHEPAPAHRNIGGTPE